MEELCIKADLKEDDELSDVEIKRAKNVNASFF